MISVGAFLGIINTFVGVLIVAVCIPLLMRRIKMNRWYGFRIKKSFESEENWYEVNEMGARIFIVWSFLLILAGSALFSRLSTFFRGFRRFIRLCR
jgi:hypothetical protein